MTDYLAFPPARRVEGTVRVPPSKSGTNRAFALASLSRSPVEIVRPLRSQDTEALLRCLAAMGASIEAAADGVRITGPIGRVDDREVLLDAGESGTAARFLTALAAAAPGRYLLTGSGRLKERPMAGLVESLRRLGARIDFREVRGQLPISILGGTLKPGRARVEASESSQYVSALLIAGAALAEPLEIQIEGPIASAPYIRMTIDSMRAFGHEVNGEGPFQVRRGERAVARYEVGGDYSSAVPLLAAAGIGGGRVTASGLRWPTSDADALALPVLEKMGISIAAEEGSVTASAGIRLLPVDVVATDFPDAVPALAALAAFADGRTRFRGVAHLRGKESDRIAALQAALAAAGATTSSDDASLSVEGPLARAAPAGPRRILTAGDHRIAMAGALLALSAPGLLLENPGCVAKSYPDFFRDLESVVVR